MLGFPALCLRQLSGLLCGLLLNEKVVKVCLFFHDFELNSTEMFFDAAAFATLDFPLTGVEVFRTDRGGGFDNARIDELLDVFDIRRSPSGKGDPYDNAVVESTNRLLKKELIYRNRYTSLEQLRSDLNDYVWWFNNQRLHSTLEYRSPKELTEQGLVL